MGMKHIMVLNDEAHHCYVDRPLQGGEKADKEQQDANEQARVWFRGLQAIAKHTGIKQIWDLSATPFYLKGSGYNEGYIFPWTVSDFSLMDAIESGIVKTPRVPVAGNAMIGMAKGMGLYKKVEVAGEIREVGPPDDDPDDPIEVTIDPDHPENTRIVYRMPSGDG